MLFWLQGYYYCECVTSAAEPAAVAGRCEGECRLLTVFLVIFALIIFVTFTTSMPALAVTLRYVFNMRRYASAAYIVIMCLCVCHMLILYQNG